MVQQEIITYLEDNKGDMFCVRQIAEAIGYEISIVSKAIKKMVKYNEVEVEEYDRDKASEMLGEGFTVFRRTRFFYIRF